MSKGHMLMISPIKKQLKLFHNSDKGAVLIMVALALLPIMLVLGLAIDSSVGLERKRKLQAAVDVAAKAGANAANGQMSAAVSEAQQLFSVNTRNMTGIIGPNITYNSTSGNVTVSASIVVPNIFMRFGGVSTSTYNASASALPTKSYGCIYALEPSKSGAINLNGATQLKVTGCGIYANSSNAAAVQLSGSANITANFLNIVGAYTTTGAANITTTQGIKTGISPVANPIGTIAIPSYAACNYNNYESPSYGAHTINPGVYCNGITISGSASITMNPGIYIIDGGSLTIGGSGTLTGNNVTIILTKKLKTSYPSIDISGAGSINLSAPIGNLSDPFNGIAVYQDPNAPSTGNNYIWGSGNLNITGIISFPNQSLTFVGAASQNTPCTIVIARNLIFQGSGNIKCSSNLLKTYMAGR